MESKCHNFLRQKFISFLKFKGFYRILLCNAIDWVGQKFSWGRRLLKNLNKLFGQPNNTPQTSRRQKDTDLTRVTAIRWWGPAM